MGQIVREALFFSGWRLMFSPVRSWERRLSALVPDLSQIEGFIKKVALALLAGQAVLCLGAVITRVMLHGDGSYFVYAIAAGEPWELKWKGLATRICFDGRSDRIF
jgi:hypothetical protein